jgi:2',3'-cyclic-nucleotide 2'-phosphodiesterase (5'-nucleotidase family)
LRLLGPPTQTAAVAIDHSVREPKTMKKGGLTKAFKILVVFMAIFALAAGCGGFREQTDETGPVFLTVLFFNDIHGHLMPFEIKTEEGNREVGGVARLATLIDRIRDENAEKGVRTVLLLAGDILQGTPMSTVFRGEPDVKCFNEMGVDAVTVGNHEFDFGLENFIQMRDQAEFPFISANITEKETGRLLCKPSKSFELSENLTLTVVGVTTAELLTTTKASNVEALDVLDSVSSVLEIYEKAKEKGPVIVLSHSKHRTDRFIAEAAPRLAAIIGGHDQILLSPFRKVGDVPIFQAFEKGRYLGRIDFDVDPVSKKAVLVSNAYIPVVSGIEANDRIEEIVASYYDKLGEQFKEVIGRSESFLDGERESVRYEETSLGNFIADIMVEQTGAQVGLVNSGGLRASIKEGPVTVEDVFKAMPYANELILVKITGEELRQVLSRSVSGGREDEDGGFLQVSGLKFDVRGKIPENIRVGENLSPIDPEAVYTVAIPDFLSTGGDGYEVFKDREKLNTRLPLRELIVDTIRSKGIVSAEKEGRINRIE